MIYFSLNQGTAYEYKQEVWLAKDNKTLIRLSQEGEITETPSKRPKPIHDYEWKDLADWWGITLKELDKLGKIIYPRSSEQGTPKREFSASDMIKIYRLAINLGER